MSQICRTSIISVSIFFSDFLIPSVAFNAPTSYISWISFPLHFIQRKIVRKLKILPSSWNSISVCDSGDKWALLLFLYLYSCKENSSYFFQLSDILEHTRTLLDIDTNNKGIIQVSLALAQPILNGSQTLTAQLPKILQTLPKRL